MRSTKLMLATALALLITAPVFAQTPEVSVLPVTEPLLVGDTLLQPGTYSIRVVPSLSGRNKVQVTSPDLQKVYASVLTVPHPLEPNEEVENTTFIYYPAGTETPRALRTWFAPNPVGRVGHDIVYDEDRARLLARAAETNVVFYPAETEVVDLDTTELRVITPEATVETYTLIPPPPPAPVIIAETEPAPMVSSTLEMPATASKLPLLALLGLLSIAGALAIRFGR